MKERTRDISVVMGGLCPGCGVITQIHKMTREKMLFPFSGRWWGGECCEGSQGAQGALAAVSPPQERRRDREVTVRRGGCGRVPLPGRGAVKYVLCSLAGTKWKETEWFRPRTIASQE